MEISFLSLFTLVLLILNSLTLTSSTPLFDSTTTDRDALLAFKNAITSDPQSVLSNNWSTNASICSWTGVSCSLNHRRVTALNLSGLSLQGSLAPHLGNLTFLQSLDISSNNFTGSIPSELSRLHLLSEINLSINQLAGVLPSGIFTNMSALIEIDLRQNELSGQLPNDTCRNTPKLERMFLSYNQLDGKIPSSIYKCTELEDMRLPFNQFNGNIPSEIGNLTMLWCLYLSNNLLEGDIPKEIGHLTSLQYLLLYGNSLTGDDTIVTNVDPTTSQDFRLRLKVSGGTVFVCRSIAAASALSTATPATPPQLSRPLPTRDVLPPRDVLHLPFLLVGDVTGR